MRLADTHASARTARQSGGTDPAGPADGPSPPDGGPAWSAAVTAFRAARDSVARARDDLELEDWPAPKRLAPHAAALAATAYREGEEAGGGKLILLHDPAGADGWTGTFRLVAQVHADVEEEMAADPLLGEVGWSWLTDALGMHVPGHAAPSGTVTRVITEGYGAKSGQPPSSGFELRASWCPADGGAGAATAGAPDDEVIAGIGGSVLAWCDLLAAAAGLPPEGTRAIGGHAAPAGAPGTRGRGGTAAGPGDRRRR